MSFVFVLNQNKQPRDPVHPALARRLLSDGKAAVFRRYPFTLILKPDVPTPEPQPLRLKLDPGSKTTGIALVDDQSGRLVWAGELTHRGQAIRDALLARRAVRRNRRQRHTRYRKPRCAPRHAALVSPTQSGRTQRRFLGQPVYLAPKGKGDNSILVKQSASRDTADGWTARPASYGKS